ncbi:Putative ATP-dependent serine protease [Fulvivirga imtechensis AK7]|uniref:Putative ATP-dependent serine protease n=1 Tax=Fulvivirga imtechensis AK7 TaxID=1237149 RepID=L8JVT2_9BACT|nr:ATP-binding protein [Fulvivirga imtechensis]ELR71719.1 Putative ATP-dependent serine protease [Fulvivirga imtechensis AK7]
MITISNYHQKVTPEIIERLPKDLQKSHEVFDQIIQFYDEDDELKETADLHVKVLNMFLSEKEKPKSQSTKKKIKSKPTESRKKKVKKAGNETKPKKSRQERPEISYVFHEDKDFYFLKRFLNLLNRPKSKHQIGLYIKALQRAIVAKEIRKNSKYAAHIIKIQEKLCNVFNKMSDDKLLPLEIDNKWMEELSAIVKREKVYKSVMLIKRYIGLEGKRAPEKVQLLLKAIENAFKKQEIVKGDPYFEMINKIRTNLKQAKEGSPVLIEQAELAGLRGIIEQYEGQELAGLACACDTPINSLDFVKVRFNTLGFKGAWKNFIGDPTPGFTALIYGKPKCGKSTLCAMFAGYLARNHGRVLYVAKEEGRQGILQERLIRVGAMHQNLELVESIPYDRLNNYDFVILDSVHKLGLNEDDLERLKKDYPNVKGWLYIMQSTKEGVFRGSQRFAHDVDVLIHVSEEGVAAQQGRFNAGSKMEIFDQNKAA